VDDRLNGDGTGLPLGINDGSLGIILATVPLAVFSLYFIAASKTLRLSLAAKMTTVASLFRVARCGAETSLIRMMRFVMQKKTCDGD